MLKEALAMRREKVLGSGKQPDGLAPSKEESPEHGDKVMKAEGAELSNLDKLAALVKDNPEASALVADMLGAQKAEMAEETGVHAEKEDEDEDEGEENPIVSQLSDYEKEDLMSREKPRSLGERAKMMALKK